MWNEQEKELEAMESSLALSLNEDEFDFLPSAFERRQKFQEVLKNILPYLGSDETKIILAEIVIALKLEGIVGKTISERDAKMIRVLNEAIVGEPTKKQQALKYAYKLLK